MVVVKFLQLELEFLTYLRYTSESSPQEAFERAHFEEQDSTVKLNIACWHHQRKIKYIIAHKSPHK